MALLIAFPIGLIGIGLVITLAMKPKAAPTAQAPAPISLPPSEEMAPEIESPPTAEMPTPDEPPTPKPLTNQASRKNSSGSTCWFQMETGGQLIGYRCSISQRINANGDKVYDVIEPSGLKRSIVLWDNNEAEVFLKGQGYAGNWRVDDDGDVRVSLPAGTFAFKPQP